MQGGRLSFGVYRRPRDAGALNARRSSSHSTARNSKERSSVAKRGRERGGGRGGLRRWSKPCGTDRRRNGISARALKRFSATGHLSPGCLFFSSFRRRSAPRRRTEETAVSREATNAAPGCANFRRARTSREHAREYVREFVVISDRPRKPSCV